VYPFVSFCLFIRVTSCTENSQSPFFSLKMLAARSAPASMSELMLAGHSASLCDMSISVEGLTLDIQGHERAQGRSLCADSKNSSSCDDSSALPAPTKFCKNSSDRHSSSTQPPPDSSVEANRAVRRALGLAIVKDEAALWSSCEEVRQISATNVSKMFFSSDHDR
jgi:hypothetical protein